MWWRGEKKSFWKRRKAETGSNVGTKINSEKKYFDFSPSSDYHAAKFSWRITLVNRKRDLSRTLRWDIDDCNEAQVEFKYILFLSLLNFWME